MTQALVQVKSAWSSKINWTQAIAGGAAILTAVGIPVSEDTKMMILTMIPLVQGGITWVMKTWFTPSVSAASVEK